MLLVIVHHYPCYPLIEIMTATKGTHVIKWTMKQIILYVWNPNKVWSDNENFSLVNLANIYF